MIENATEELHKARRRHLSEQAQATLLRRLVTRIDGVIEDCEEAHLQGYKEVPSDLRDRSGHLFAVASRVVRRRGDEEAKRTVETALGRNMPKITDVMDALWTIQEVVFDLMLPWRTQLPDDVEQASAITAAGAWRADYAA